MKKLLSPAILLSIWACLHSSPAKALDCLIEQFKDHTNYTENDYLSYSVNDYYTRNYSRNDKTDFGISYAGYGLNYDQATQINDKIRDILHIDLTYEQRKSLMVATLTPNGLNAYQGCLQALGTAQESIVMHLSPHAISSPNFLLYIKYRPDTDKRPVRITLAVSGKELIDGHPKVFSKRALADDDAHFVITRDRMKPTEFTLTVTSPDNRNRDYLLYLPGAASTTIGKVDLRSDHTVAYRTGTPGGAPTNAVWRLPASCVSIPDGVGGIIIPNTVTAPLLKTDFTGGLIDEPRTVYGERSSCIDYRARYTATSGDLAHMGGEYTTTATAFEAVPIIYPSEIDLPMETIPDQK